MENNTKTKTNSDVRTGEEESDSTSMSLLSEVSNTARGKRASKRGRKSPISKRSESSDSSEAGPASFVKPQLAKRGRGRQPTLSNKDASQIKEAFLKQKQENVQLLSEEEILKMAKMLDVPCEVKRTSDQLVEHAQTGIKLILNVAKKSGRLKGTMISSLKKATSAIQEVVEALQSRTVNEEVEVLRAANARQQREINAMKEEMIQFKATLEAQRSGVGIQDSQTLKEIEEVLRRNIMLEVGTMVNAKWESISDRLLPETRIRPPLQADINRSIAEKRTEMSRLVPKISVSNQPEVLVEKVVSDPINFKNQAKRKKQMQEKAQSSTLPQTQTQNTVSNDWQVVTKKRKAPPSKSKSEAMTVQNTRKESAASRAQKLRAPSSTAVVLTLQPGALERGVSYASILKDAKSKLPMETLGISSVRIRMAATGARVLEIPGAMSGEKADSLAAELRKALNSEDVRIARPNKCAELRISELDESITSSEVAAAVAKAGGCLPEEVKTGVIRLSPSGLGSLWLRCPVVVAKKVAASRLLVGWVSARVDLLEPKPTRCYKCMELGHVRARCPTEVDRSNTCYRCGEQEHLAQNCEKPLRCSLCEAAGRPSNHFMGSKACTGPIVKPKTGSPCATIDAAPQNLSAETMDASPISN